MAIKKPTIPHAELRNEMRKEEQAGSSLEPDSASQANTPDPAQNTRAYPEPETAFRPPKTRREKPVSSPDSAEPRTGHAEASEKMTISVSAPIPEKGVSKLFEALLQHHSEQEALRLILKKALPIYESALIDGSFQKSPKDYPAKPATATTRRAIKHEAFNVVKQAFDPLDVYTLNKIGRMIATAALAAFFKNEKNG
ncbi:VirC2 family conjugal transfer protein [Roseibium litorale]|uniref:VirC2 family conjugal transfer protein n=1 Tax=Roseibium litorale TaxID=2803841 RepID=A0ABR9CRU6_9HYPH|nr:VirC2 family conjugal transfer protein [Roseibium litorale]MBD8893569.1 VirC2 family conjugal transfer protein [Roseibium litorale]